MSRKQAFQFLDLPRTMPQRIPVELRTSGDWGELYGKFGKEDAQFQAGRCLDCGNPYCSWRCPVHNAIPQWLQLVRQMHAVGLERMPGDRRFIERDKSLSEGIVLGEEELSRLRALA